jgi:hypothetical protein
MLYNRPKPDDALEVGDIFMFKLLSGQGYFIVTDAGYAGGCDGHDPWPNAWTVRYMRVPDQDLIHVPRRFKMSETEEYEASKVLSQGGPFSDEVPPDQINKVGKMTRSVTVSYDQLKIFDPTLRKQGSLKSR